MNKSVVIVGGGWAGCAAALAASKRGINAILLERTDMLLGTGLVGGIMRNNGRFTAAEEMIAMGGGDLFEICDRTARHTNVDFPGHQHATLYDIAETPIAVEKHLLSAHVQIYFKTRIVKAETENHRVVAVEDEGGRFFAADAFVDATGTAGPINNCTKHGNGCAACVLRCPTFGGRVSLSGKAGVCEVSAQKDDGTYGAMSGSCKLYKESLSPAIQNALNTRGLAVVPIPEKLIKERLDGKACQQYALPAYQNNLVLLDTGHAKLMTPFFELESLRSIPGFEKARYEDPYSGGVGNSMRYFEMTPHDDTLKVSGLENLFCAGEKAGPLVGHTEAIVTGTLAGYNAARAAMQKQGITLSSELAVGDAVRYVGEMMQSKQGLSKKYTFSGSVYFDRMKERNLYTVDTQAIQAKVERLGMRLFFS